ncbi:kinetochore scaffold 1 [Cebidichthys violaceus]|uniref:kinetochore scaffold 1 n=1 Tax=Cebidichthys violaceus TaxID=271503 RepID=UPI0035C94AAF
MEPLDPAKNDEGSGFSKRRISSILKAPRRSVRFSEPQQQENVVECVKPVEKRNSRRVSFAPANDVLLFSKDVKNASPARSPLQELITTATSTQNRVQLADTEDGIQQILGMETLLNAPLHASQQREKADFETGRDFGEKTVMFSTDDAFLDMTHSHTINIANDAALVADISLQNYDSLPARGENRVKLTASDGAMDMSLSHNANTGTVSVPTSRNMDLRVEKRNKSSPAPTLDAGFENFLSSLSKPSDPGVITTLAPAASSERTNCSTARIKTQRADVDKENQAPTSVSAVMEKSLNSSKKIGAFSHGSALCPEEDLSMDMTEAQTGRILGLTDDEDPFQCLFPTQEMYSHHDSRVSQTKEKKEQISKPSFNPKDMTSLKNPSQHDFNQRHKDNLDRADECSAKTIMFTAGDDFMDMTQSHTVNTASSSFAPSNQNVDIFLTLGKMDNASSLEEGRRETCGTPGLSAFDLGFRNVLSGPSEPGAPSGTPVIARMVPSTAAPSRETVDRNSSLSQLKRSVGKENQSLNTTRASGESFNGGTISPEDDVSMDMTGAQTGRIIGLTGSDDPFQFLFPTQDMYPSCGSLKKQEMTSGQKNNDALESSNRTGMETSLKTRVQRNPVKFDAGDDYGEKTVRFTADDAAMDMTQGLTVNIASNLISDALLPVKKQDGWPRNRSAHSLNPSFTTSLSKSSGPSGDPVITRMMPTAAQSSDIGDSSNGGTICPEEDVSMDMTEAQTGRILGSTGTDDSLQCLFPTEDMYTQSGSLKKQEMTSGQKNNEALESSNRKGMETSLKTRVQSNPVKFDAEDDCREKTVRFTADDACMDLTQSHNVNIATDFKLQSLQNSVFVPAYGEKTVRFTADDAAMDMTQGLTVNIASNLLSDALLPVKKQDGWPRNRSAHSLNPSFTTSLSKSSGPSGDPVITRMMPTAAQSSDIGDSSNGGTICPEEDVSMDMTEAQTGRILGSTGTDDSLQCLFPTEDMYTQSGSLKKQEMTSGQKNNEALESSNRKGLDTSLTASLKTKVQKHQVKFDAEDDCREKTVRFTAEEACMDVTRNPTVNIATDFAPQSHQREDFLPACGEKTVRFTATDAAMDVTQCLTVNIAHNSASKSHLRRSNRSLPAHALDPGFKNSLSMTSGPWANPVIARAVAPAEVSPQKAVDTKGFLDQVKTQKLDVDPEKEAPAFVSAAVKKPINETMMGDDVSMDMTEAQTGCILAQTDEPPQCLSSTQDVCPDSDHSKKTGVTSQLGSEALGSSEPDGVEITNLPDSLPSNETVTGCEPRNQTGTLSQKMESSPSAVAHDVDAAPSQKSRRMSLADLQSKVRRLSHITTTAPVAIAVDSCTAAVPRLEHDMDRNSQEKTKCTPVTEPEPEVGLVNTEENTQAQSLTQEEEEPFTTTTPFNLKTKQLMSRLSMGSFKAKLPQRGKPEDPKKQNPVGEHTRTVDVTSKLSNFDIYDEELVSYEDMSETLDMSPQRADEKVSSSYGFHTDELLEEDVFKPDFVSSVHGKKRPLPGDENNMEDEKRMKTSTEVTTDIETAHVVECDGNITTAPSTTTQTSDYSNSSHTASTRCEATFESSFRQSLFESQFEDYTNDVQKLSDGTITLLEFFNLFNIDFVIHNPRQSILPGRLLSDTDRTPMDLWKDRHIYRPKQMVYETDVLNLTEKVEGLKERMRDRDKPLKIVNRPLWEEVRHFTEKELKSFGAKLKERNNLFRKLSKVQSHEMKEGLYSNLMQANLEEQQWLRGKIEEADEMLKSLDDCIRESETELNAVEEKGFEGKPSLNSRQEEMQTVAEALADNDRQISELEMQKKQNSNKLNRLKAETRNLESHVNGLHMVNEWKFAEKTDNCTTYTFLHETLHLELLFEQSSGTDAGDQSERKISHVAFKHQLDDEKSQGHACLVHKLLSEYVEGEREWVERYPTSRHVPKLLHDVGLVVSRCRLLGEELRLLKMWGGLRLDILDISCMDTRVHIVFSCLKTFSKFEVIFSVGVIDHLCVLQVQSFKNVIGNTTIQQIEEIVASFSPAKNLLTKIVKTIHDNLLC